MILCFVYAFGLFLLQALYWLAEARLLQGDVAAARGAILQSSVAEPRRRQFLAALEQRERRDLLVGASMVGVGLAAVLGVAAWIYLAKRSK